MAHIARASFEQQSDRNQNRSGSSPVSDWSPDVGLDARASRDHGSESPDENSCLSLPVHAMIDDDRMVSEHNLAGVNVHPRTLVMVQPFSHACNGRCDHITDDYLDESMARRSHVEVFGLTFPVAPIERGRAAGT